MSGIDFHPPEAIILAGGFGTRVRAVLPGRQKVMAPVSGEPFLARILRNFHIAGVRRVILALGYRADDVINSIETIAPPGMTIEVSVEPSPMGTGGALKYALHMTKTTDLLVANGDSMIDYPIASLIRFHRQRQSLATLLLCVVPDVSRYGTVLLGEGKQILSFREKQTEIHCPGIINAGVYMMSRDFIAGFPDGFKSLEKDVFPLFCGKGIYGMTTYAPFIDIGTPSDYSKADKFFSQLDSKENP